MKTGVLIHGRHVDTTNWDKIVWGIPPDRLGQIPRGLLVALEEKAEFIVFGTGASMKGGLLEAEYTIRYLRYNFKKLNKFKSFTAEKLKGIKTNFLDKQDKLIPETKSKNTYEEVTNAGEIFTEKGITKVILVSCPTHISRCLRDAYKAFLDARYYNLAQNLYATPSDVSYAGYEVDNVVILEPPHRPDKNVNQREYLYKTVKYISEVTAKGDILFDINVSMRK